MADLSKIKLNGTEYELKDAVARAGLENIPTISVSQTITSGTEIGSVNNTKLYAPTPYDDTELAARVTALEELEWATYYSGRTTPSDSQGQNGDIYLQY